MRTFDYFKHFVMENFKPIQNLDNSINFYVSTTQLQKSLTHGQLYFICIPSTRPSLGYIHTNPKHHVL